MSDINITPIFVLAWPELSGEVWIMAYAAEYVETEGYKGGFRMLCYRRKYRRSIIPDRPQGRESYHHLNIHPIERIQVSGLIFDSEVIRGAHFNRFSDLSDLLVRAQEIAENRGQYGWLIFGGLDELAEVSPEDEARLLAEVHGSLGENDENDFAVL